MGAVQRSAQHVACSSEVLTWPARMPETHIGDITRVIQLAIAPVFLLTAVGTIIGVLSNRLARVVDRTRALENQLAQLAHGDLAKAHAELEVLARRMRLVYLAIGLSVVCAIFVGLLIVFAFFGAFLSVDLARLVGLLFIAAMLGFIASLSVFLREIFLAVTSARDAIHSHDPAPEQRSEACPPAASAGVGSAADRG